MHSDPGSDVLAAISKHIWFWTPSQDLHSACSIQEYWQLYPTGWEHRQAAGRSWTISNFRTTYVAQRPLDWTPVANVMSGRNPCLPEGF
jgi:hypothetical protein